jgi:beta-glucosidase
VAAGQAARLTVRADDRLWRKWNTAENRWDRVAEGGELLVARGLGDIRATLPLA